MSAGALLSIWLSQDDAVAGGQLGENGQAIQTSRYSIDFFQGPVYSGSRVIGLGGAYVALAEDVDGNLQNPAAPAVRPYYSVDYFDYYPGFSISYPSDIENTDFFNSGSPTALRGAPTDFVFATPALNLQWGTFGFGGTAEIQNYGFGDTPEAQMGGVPGVNIVVNTIHLQAANAFLDGQLVIGLGTRVLTMVVEGQTEQSTRRLFSSTGNGLELGALFKPNNQPFRIGAALREGVQTNPNFSKDLLPDANGDITIPGEGGPIYLPERVSAPWDINLGAAVQFGRPFNPPWRSGEDLAERASLHYRLKRLDREDERRQRLTQAKSDEERARIERQLDAEQARDDELLERAIENGRLLIRSRNAALEHYYLLLSASLLVSGKATQSVGVDSFLSQEVNRSGERVVYSPRVGAESELWPDLFKARVGSYLEPTRFETSSARWHLTTGLDVRLIRWNVLGLWPRDYLWRASVSADMSQRYLVWALSIGGWYPRWAEGPF